MELLIWAVVEILGYLVALIPWGGGGREEPKRTPAAAPAVRLDAVAVTPRGPCAFCRKKDGTFVACGKCRAPHHAQCAGFNRRCAVFGCGGREFRGRAA